MQRQAGIEYPLQGILDGLESPPIRFTACTGVIVFTFKINIEKKGHSKSRKSKVKPFLCKNSVKETQSIKLI
tara:strand:- start:318 stop:533 length:216 start_codon:yes stop_codon:yes gene_type:complete